MATYQITGPDGHKYRIEGPDGASDVDLVNEVFKAYPDVEKPDGIVDLKTGRWEPNTPAAPVIETPTPQASTENLFSIPNQGGWGLSEETRQALGAGGPIEALRPITDIPANVADLGYRGLQAVQAGLGELAVGADEVARRTGLADALSTEGGKFLPGTAAMGILEAVPQLGATPELGANISIGGNLARNAQLAPDVEAGLSQMFQTGTVDDIVSYARQAGRDIDPEAVVRFVSERDAGAPISTRVSYADAPQAAPARAVEGEVGLPGELASEGEAGIPGPQFRPKAEAVVEEAPAPTQIARAEVEPEYVPSKGEQDIAKHADDLTEQWTNKPDVVVYDHFDDADGIDPGSLGVYDPETGQVLLNTKMIEREAKLRNLPVEEMTNTVLFHEGLGHYGLAQQFRNDLDNQLLSWYNQSDWFRKKTDDWMNNEKNVATYADEDNLVARAAEEVLAELSETGPLPKTFVNTLKNKIKAYARDLGFEWNVSEREIRTVMAQVHEAVRSGKKADVVGNGFRSMKSAFGESKGVRQGGSISEDAENVGLGPVRSNRNIDEILKENAPERAPETHKEWIDDAGKIKMTGKAATNLAKGADVPEMLAAEQYAVRSANRIYDLSRKANLTERESYLLQKEQERLANVIQSVYDVKSQAGRILNASKIEVGSDKALTDAMRRMLSTADLTTPEGRAAVTEAIEKSKVSEARKKVLRNLNNAVSQVVNLPFSMMSTLDLSAPLRQGRSLAHTKQFWKGIAPMFSMASKAENFKAVMKEIQARPTFRAMEDSGLFLADVGKQLSKREERFMSSWASKIPGFGRAVRFSERGYVGFLNKLRADTFDDLVRQGQAAGVDYLADPEGLKKLASFVNNATGRGDIKFLTEAGPLMNGLFFSPRLMASRIKLLNPVTYATLPPVVRREAIKALLATGGTSLAAGYLASLAGANLELDPRSSDFMKIKTGNTRYDTLGGFGQYVTLAARLITNQSKNAKQDIVELGKKFGSDTRKDVAWNFLESKFSPLASFVKEWMDGKTFGGEEFKASKAAVERFIPLFVQDVIEGYKDEGLVGAVKTAPSFFGVGSTTYDPPKGADRFGRGYDTKRDMDDPVVKEVDRLEKATDSELFREVPKSLVIDGEKVSLTETEHKEYQTLVGQWIMEDIHEEMASPDWANYSDEEKVEIIKDITKQAKEDARNELFYE